MSVVRTTAFTCPLVTHVASRGVDDRAAAGAGAIAANSAATAERKTTFRRRPPQTKSHCSPNSFAEFPETPNRADMTVSFRGKRFRKPRAPDRVSRQTWLCSALVAEQTQNGATSQARVAGEDGLNPSRHGAWRPGASGNGPGGATPARCQSEPLFDGETAQRYRDSDRVSRVPVGERVHARDGDDAARRGHAVLGFGCGAGTETPDLGDAARG